MKKNILYLIAIISIFSIIGFNNILIGIANAEQEPPPQSNMIPHARAGGPYYGTVAEAIEFDGCESYDSDGEVVNWTWDWNGDDIYDTGWLSNCTTTHQYRNVGAYTVKLKVKDDDNASSWPNETIAYVNGDSSLQPSAYNEHICRVNQWIDFNVSVQNVEGPDVYWIDVKVEIYNWTFGHVTWLHDDHWNTTSDPLEAPSDAAYFDYEDAWKTNDPGQYYIRCKCYNGYDWTWSDYDGFYVFQ